MRGTECYKEDVLTIVCPNVSQVEIEREQENKLKARYPGVKTGGGSALLQKRLAKPVSCSEFLLIQPPASLEDELH